MDIGVVLNYDESLENNFKWCTENNITTCQLAVYIEDQTQETIGKLKDLCKKYNIRITALVGVCSGPGEYNFHNGPVTLGLVPPAYRAMRLQQLEGCARFAKMLGVTDICTHLGFIPENPGDPLYIEFISAVRNLTDYFKTLGINLNMETGQETPVTLLRVINDVRADNLGINFDPANLLMYGKANPVDALSIIGPYIKGVHGKDGEYPTNSISLGVEKPLGEGRVNFELFIKTLHETGYKGAITIEREISGEQQKHDVLVASRLLRKIIQDL